jgi:uncharacterized membrane protein
LKKQANINITVGALIAALYAGMTYFSSVFGLAYGPLQFRFSEALTILPFFTPAAIPGLVIGCFIGNLGSPYGLVDIIFGTLATLLAALTTRALGRSSAKYALFLAALPPVVFNALIIGAEVTFFLPESLTFKAFAASAAWIGLGEFVVCLGLGLPLALALKKSKVFEKFQSN